MEAAGDQSPAGRAGDPAGAAVRAAGSRWRLPARQHQRELAPPRQVGRLAAGVAASLGAGAGLEAAELAIRAAVMKLGRSVLEPLLAADGGYRGPRVSCGAGHLAEFVAYREKTTDTVLGPVTLSRAWYHCGDCGHGLAPRDAELGVAGQTMSPGLARMNDRAAAAVPFTPAARLVGELAGITLTGRRARPPPEAAPAAAPPRCRGPARR